MIELFINRKTIKVSIFSLILIIIKNRLSFYSLEVDRFF